MRTNRALQREGILKTLRENRELLQEFGVDRLSLVGSFARDEGRDDSDVDLLVEFNRPIGLFQFARLQRQLGELLLADRPNLPEGVPWTDVAAMRNILIHEYFGVDRAIIWQTVGSLRGDSRLAGLPSRSSCPERAGLPAEARTPTESVRRRVASRRYGGQPSHVDWRAKVGGRQEARTPDLRVANAALSQLS